MNKYRSIIGLSLFLSIILSGCNGNIVNQFEGTWRAGTCIHMGEIFGSMTMICEFTFTGETVYMELHFAGIDTTLTKSGTYETSGNKLFINSEGYTFSFDYEFETVENALGEKVEKLILENDISENPGNFFKK